jgi:hypothetical protein
VAPWGKALFHRFVLQSGRTIATKLFGIDGCLILFLLFLTFGWFGILACNRPEFAAAKQAGQTDPSQ